MKVLHDTTDNPRYCKSVWAECVCQQEDQRESGLRSCVTATLVVQSNLPYSIQIRWQKFSCNPSLDPSFPPTHFGDSGALPIAALPGRRALTFAQPQSRPPPCSPSEKLPKLGSGVRQRNRGAARSNGAVLHGGDQEAPFWPFF